MLKEELLKLLEEDRDFRLTVAGLLGYRDILEKLGEHDKKFNELLQKLDEHTRTLQEQIRILQEHTEILREHTRILREHTEALREYSKRFESIEQRLEVHDRKFNELLQRLDEHSKRFESIEQRLEVHDRKFNELLQRLDEHSKRFESIEQRLEVHDRKFNELMGELLRLRKEFEKLNMRVEVTIGSIGRRWGADLERMVLEIYREVLEKKGIEPGKVEKFKYKDRDGSLTGVKGRIIDVDVLVRDDKVYVIEVKSRAELESVEALPEKARVVERVLGRKVERIYLVAVNVDKEAFERAVELGIEVVCGHVIE